MGSQCTLSFTFPIASVVLAMAAPTLAQCTSQWTRCAALGGTNGAVSCAAWWDPDGVGPLTARIVLAGNFTAAGTTLANGVCAFDPATGAWQAFGSGLYAGISALVGMPNGDLVVAGQFNAIGGVLADNVARWNGSSWQAMATGLPGPALPTGARVNALALRPNGEIVAGGVFTIPGTAGLDFLAVWTGVQWVPVPSGSVDGVVGALATMPNGDVAVTGAFATAGGVPANRLARWDGTSWYAIPAGPTSGRWVTCLTAAPNGDLLAGGESQTGVFPNVSYTGYAWRWNGTSWAGLWSATASGWFVSSPMVNAIAATANGGFAVGGYFLHRSVSGMSTTVTLPIFWRTNCLLALPSNEVLVGGTNSNGGGPDHVFRWDAAGIASLSPATNDTVMFAQEDRNGALVAAGLFTSIDDVAANRIARATGGVWSPMGSGADGPILAGARLEDGSLVVAGQFTQVAGMAAANLARWDGTNWSPLGVPNGTVDFVHGLPGGGFVVAGSFTGVAGVPAAGIARWDGTAWHAYGGGLFGTVTSSFLRPRVEAVVPRANGGLVVVGEFSLVPNGTALNVAEWNGTAWTAVLPGRRCSTAAVLPNGDVALGGNFLASVGLPYGHLVRWDGTAFHAFGAPDGAVRAITKLANGDLVVAGEFTQIGGLPVQQVARWNGVTWSSVANGGGLVYAFAAERLRLQRTAAGDLLLHGRFQAVDGVTTSGFARLTPTCPAIAQPFGAGCTGSGGPNVLTATELPWLGAQFAATASGIAPNSLALLVAGVTPAATPMAAILPAGGAGCTLHVTPDLVWPLVPTGGSVAFGFPIPVVPALVGSGLNLQVAPLEFDLVGAIVGLTGTNALALTVGVQ